MDKVQNKPNSSVQHKPSSESFQVYLFLTSLYGNTFKRDRSFHILRFLHNRDNNAEIERKADNCDRLWEIRTNFDILNDALENYYNPSEHLAADEIILKIKRRVVT
jgi:hypothetical protein